MNKIISQLQVCPTEVSLKAQNVVLEFQCRLHEFQWKESEVWLMQSYDLRSMRPKVVAPRSTQVDAPQPPCHSAPHARSMRPKANNSAPHELTSNGSWRQGIKGEMTCTVYVALVWNIIYWKIIIMIMIIIITTIIGLIYSTWIYTVLLFIRYIQVCQYRINTILPDTKLICMLGDFY